VGPRAGLDAVAKTKIFPRCSCWELNPALQPALTELYRLGSHNMNGPRALVRHREGWKRENGPPMRTRADEPYGDTVPGTGTGTGTGCIAADTCGHDVSPVWAVVLIFA
jgi:hypothetical protein